MGIITLGKRLKRYVQRVIIYQVKKNGRTYLMITLFLSEVILLTKIVIGEI
jgi:hypothetical protein